MASEPISIAKSDRAIYSRNEYEKLAHQIKTSLGIEENELQRPDDGDVEYFTVWLDFTYFNKLAIFFRTCKDPSQTRIRRERKWEKMNV